MKLIFWLALRGWGKQRIAKFFNRHLRRIPTWGVKGKKAAAWHYSYVQKVLHNPAVLGQIVLHTTRETGPGESRKPLGPAVRGYYPQIIDEATFLRVQKRKGESRPKGPFENKAGNLFQGLLRDGEYPEFSMWFRNHGGPGQKWVYVVSDHRRLHPEAPIFSWPYLPLEMQLLSLLSDMDWSPLTAGKDAELRHLKKDLDTKEARAADLGRQLKRLIELAKTVEDVEEVTSEIRSLKQRRDSLQNELALLKGLIDSKRKFDGEAMTEIIRSLAGDRENPASRIKLREAIRAQVSRIELYRKFPSKLLNGVKMPVPRPGLRLSDFITARCLRIVFRNGAERWMVDRTQDDAMWFEGSCLPAEHLRILAMEDQANGHDGSGKEDEFAESAVNLTGAGARPKAKTNRDAARSAAA